MDKMLEAYVECALWSSTDDDGRPLDGVDAELAPATIEEMARECADFRALLEREGLASEDDDAARMGHDFWLTRNGHGAGFWDRPGVWGGKERADKLSMWAKSFGSYNLLVGDDGQIHGA